MFGTTYHTAMLTMITVIAFRFWALIVVITRAQYYDLM